VGSRLQQVDIDLDEALHPLRRQRQRGVSHLLVGRSQHHEHDGEE